MADLFQNARLAWRLLNDPRVPTWLKVVVPLVIALYFVSPVDIVPDFIVGAGELDDLGVLLLGMSLFVRLAPQYVVDEHRRAMGLPVAGGGNQYNGSVAGTQWWPPNNSNAHQDIGDHRGYRGYHGYRGYRGPASPAGYVRHTGQPTRPIEGEYRVIPPDS